MLHVNVSDRRGGAAIAAYRLNAGLRNIEINSQILAPEKTTSDKFVFSNDTLLEKATSKVVGYLDRLPLSFFETAQAYRTSLSFFSNPFFLKKINELDPDIVNLHWTCDGVLRPEFLKKINASIVWTMHDSWPFCGSENYTTDTARYRDGYYRHNRNNQSTGLDVDRWMYKRKLRAYSKRKDMVFISPSKWLCDEALSSALLSQYDVRHIPNGLNTELFRPIGKSVSRKVLGLPEDKKIILFGAAGGVTDARKGFDLLAQSLNLAARHKQGDNVLLVIYGGEAPANNQLGLPCVSLGRLNDETSLVLAFSAADVFVIPSRMDNLPNTVLESLSCGTPVVGFNVGGMPDMIRHRSNGYIADAFSVEDLSNGILHVLERSYTDDSMSVSARKTIMESFSIERQALAYQDLYQSLMT